MIKLTRETADCIYWASFFLRRIVVLTSIMWAAASAAFSMWVSCIFFVSFATFLLVFRIHADLQLKHLLDDHVKDDGVDT